MTQTLKTFDELRWWALAIVSTLALAWPQAAQGQAGPPAWEVDYANSEIVFGGRQMGVPVDGSFEKFTADIRFDASRPERSSVVVEVDMTSVRLPVAEVEREVQRPKWFNAEAFPTGRFESTEIEPKGENRYEAKGKLTLRDVTKDVVLPFELSVEDDPQRAGHLKAVAVGEMTVRRLDYGIGQAEWRDTNIVTDEVSIRIKLSGSRPK